MRKSICHFSFHRLWKQNNWSIDTFAQEVKKLGVEGIDFHMGLVGDRPNVAKEILDALAKHGLTLSGLSFSNNFTMIDPAEIRTLIDRLKGWLRLGAEVRTPISRVFGTLHRELNEDAKVYEAARQRVINALGELTQEAQKYGIVLALENHGGIPATGEEQVEIIKEINSPFLRATIDVANYMHFGREGHIETAKAAPYAAYVHFKDFKKVPDAKKPWGWTTQPCTVGDGDMDLKACYQALKKAGYNGFVALEYEGPEDETTGVPRSVQTLNAIMK